MNIDYLSIGQRIRKFRERLHLTQAELSEKSGIAPSNISHIERGATKASLPTLIMIANSLNVTLDELVYGSLVKNEHVIIKEINELLEDCNNTELKSICEIIRTTKSVLRKNAKE